MAVFRVEKNKNYTCLSNYHLLDKELSLKAKGLLSIMLSLPENWDYSLKGLVALVKEEETAVRNALKELKDNHYLEINKLEQTKDNKGLISYEYNVFEKPCTVKPYMENPYTVNQVQQNTDIQNTNILNTNINNNNNNNIISGLNQKTAKRFVKPAIEEIIAYIKEKGFNIDANYFYNYYESNGWKVGRNPMKNWKATLNMWNSRNNKTPKVEEINPILDFMLARYEDKGLAQNPTLKARYIKQWTKTANDLLDACGGDLELAKKMIALYSKKQNGEEWYLWGVLNNFCSLYEELKRGQYVKR